MLKGKFVAFIALITVTAILLNLQKDVPHLQFEQWKTNFGVRYSSEFENLYRQKVFMQNLANINTHNSDPERTYEMGVNQFTAMNKEEFTSQYLGTIVRPETIAIEDNGVEINAKIGEIDWESAGAVTKVKSQGNCGACWAFSAIASVEGLSKIAYGKLTGFSVQQLVDCANSRYGNQGCNGGLIDNGFKYIIKNGVVPQDEYPYKGYNQNCSKQGGSFKISGFVDVKGCSDLETALTGIPIAVAVDATNWSPYKSGVFSNCKTSLNHGVLLTGMTDQYWRIKNSWGTGWGENGYIKLARGNTCGICNSATYPLK